MIGRQSQRKAIQRLSGAAGAKLIGRYFLNGAGTLSMPAPAGTGWIIARCVGPGGGSDRNNLGVGGGGAFAREDRACSPGQTVSAQSYDGVTGTNGTAPFVKLNGTVICQADPGKADTSSGAGLGGLAANSIGTIKRSGGNGSAGSSPGSSGQFGGPGGTGNFSGGGSGGETDALDCFVTGGRGSDGSGGTQEYGGRGGFPGGGAALRVASGGAVQNSLGGNGQVIVEFWSGKP